MILIESSIPFFLLLLISFCLLSQLMSEFQELNILSTKTSQPALSMQNLRTARVVVPPLPEQRKIAEILSTWDEAIAKTEALIASLEQRKKGLMQRLLTGQVRFPGFTDPWREVKLREVGKISSGGTPSTIIAEYWDGDIPWATPTDITSLQTRNIEKTKRKITRKGLENSSAVINPVGSLLICSRATIGEIAINTLPMSTNQGFKNLIPNNNFNNDYLFHLIKFNKHQLIRFANGSTFLELSKKDFEKIIFYMPKIEEQRKIANVINGCDIEIEVGLDRVKKLKKQKKGLMQRLLTGEVRVKV